MSQDDSDALRDLLITIRRDQADLYEIVDKLRRRLALSEAMAVALAATHPNYEALLQQLGSWMNIRVDMSLNAELRATAESERTRVLEYWQALLVEAMPNPRVVLH